MRCSSFLLVFTLALSCLSTAQAQWSLRQTRADYAQPTVYGPQDPWTKGSVYRTQTGHSGWFYNCDEEECKRNSPYICWKAQDNTEHIRSYWSVLKADWSEVKQRIRAGSCMGPGCETCPPETCFAEGATPGCTSCQVPMTSATAGVGYVVDSSPATLPVIAENSPRMSVAAEPAAPTTSSSTVQKQRNHIRLTPAKESVVAAPVVEVAPEALETATKPTGHLRRR